MEFGIGFAVGGLLTGFAAAKSGTMLKAFHARLAKIESAVRQKMQARTESFKSKL